MRFAILIVWITCEIGVLGICLRNKRYVKWIQGSPNTNVIISAPHDGYLKPSTIPNRKVGCYDSTTRQCDWRHDCHTRGGVRVSGKCKVVLHADSRSSDLAEAIQKEITKLTGKAPHMIISKLHRSKLDPNRDKDNAAQHNSIAEKAYDDFHGCIQKAHDLVQGPGLQFDIHGYTTHAVDNWIEFGYRISTEDLNADRLQANTSSVRALAGRTSVSFEELIRGKTSMGGFAEEFGYRTVPSPRYPRPSAGKDEGREGKYFRGGYITQKWGSAEKGDIDCIQIEFPQWTRNKSDIHGPKIGQAIVKFLKKYYS